MVVAPTATLGADGVMVMDVTAGAVTVSVAALDVMPFNEAVMVLLPMPLPVAIPLALITATPMSLEFQMTEPEILPEVASEYVPVAVNMVVVPFGIDAAAGAIVMPDRVAAVTVMAAAGEVMPLMEAVTVVFPTVTPFTTPVLLPTFAVAGSADTQVTEVVMSAVELFE